MHNPSLQPEWNCQSKGQLFHGATLRHPEVPPGGLSHLSDSSSYLPDTLPWRVVQAMTSLMGARIEMFYLERVAPPRGLTVLLTAMVVATARILSSHARVMAALI